GKFAPRPSCSGSTRSRSPTRVKPSWACARWPPARCWPGCGHICSDGTRPSSAPAFARTRAGSCWRPDLAGGCWRSPKATRCRGSVEGGSMGNHVKIEVNGGIGILTLDRGQRFNSLDVETAQDFREAGLLLARDERVRVAVLRGVRGAFCSGADLKYIR